MSEQKKRTVWPWIVVILVALPILYVASFGPACWLAGDWTERNTFANTIIPNAYYPILWLARLDRPEIAPGVLESGWFDDYVYWYATLWRDDPTCPVLCPDGDTDWYYSLLATAGR
jgi:hypothetical protein